MISHPAMPSHHLFQRETHVSMERAQMMEKLPISHGKLLPWLNRLPENQRHGEHEPLSPDGAHVQAAEEDSCWTPLTQQLSLRKGEQPEKQNLSEETPITLKSSCASRKLQTSKFYFCPGQFVRGTSRCVGKYGSLNTVSQ